MKAILVIDMPDSCEECEYCAWSSDKMYRACLLNNCHLFRSEFVEIGRDGCCPLKPLPTEFKTYKLSQRDQEETEPFINMAMIKVYADGYNACLKEIEGD